MRRIIFLLGTYGFSISMNLFAGASPGVGGSFDIGPGYRTDNLNWSIAGPSGFPDVMSEVKWEELQIGQLMARGHLNAWDHVYVKALADYGWIQCGKSTDANFLTNGRTNEFAAFNADSKNGNVFDLSGGIGINLFKYNSPYEFAPLLGYSLHGQNLVMDCGRQTIDPNPLNIGGITGLKVHYDSRWKGPWVGADFSVKPTCNLKLEASFEYHWLCFGGKGDWLVFNPATPNNFFQNKFHQSSHGTGTIVSGGISYELSGGWGFGLYSNYGRMKTRDGRHQSSFGTDGSIDTLDPSVDDVGTLPIVVETQLNPVTWHTFSITFEFDAEF